MSATEGLSKQEQELLIQLLNKIPTASKLDTCLFAAMGRHLRMASIEVVVYRFEKNLVEVLLTKRPDGDPFFDGQYASVGAMVAPAHHCIADALSAIYHKLDGIKLKNPPKFAEFVFTEGPRGPEMNAVHTAEIEGQPTKGIFYPLTSLPEKLTFNQPAILAAASKAIAQSR